MIRNYNCLSNGRDTWLKNDVGETLGSPPTSSDSARTRWFAFLLMLLSIFVGQNGYSQVAYTQNFNAGAASWTGFSSLTGASACGGSGGSMVFNLYSGSTTANFVSPLLGTSNGTLHTLNFDYKVAVWSANTVGQSGNWGNFNVQWGTSAAGPWTTLATINNTNHVVSGNCANKSYTFTPPNGSTVYLRFNAAWGTTGDFYLNFDNVSLQGVVTSPPNCIASPTSPANVGTGFTNGVLTWPSATGAPSGYKVYVGSDGGGVTTPTNIVNGVNLGNVNTYTISSALSPLTTYYWQIVPLNAFGDATGCTVWSFTTGSPPVCTAGNLPATGATGLQRWIPL